MPKGPRGELCPVDVAQRAHRVFQIAIGEVVEDVFENRPRGPAGAAARASGLSNEARTEIAKTEIAKKAASARWSM